MRRRPLKLIPQRHRTECGAACVAMLAGVSLEKARSALYEQGESRSLRTYEDDIRRALNALGFILGREIWTSNWSSVAKQSRPVLVALNYKPKPTKRDPDQYVWHWAVYEPCAPHAPLLDPQSKSSPRLPGRSKLASYFKVSRIEA